MGGFECPKCHGEMKYEFATHSFKCKCGYIEKTIKQQKRCFHCGRYFDSWEWFDPSSCPFCGHSFVN